jgi:hypothetical protein
MEGSLNQAHSNGLRFVRPLHHSVHELSPCARILYGGIDRDWAYTANNGTLIQTVASDQPSLPFSNNRIAAGSRKHK